MSNATQTHYRACNLCEAICGLEIRTQGDEILSIRGDKKDPVSEGFICPKATALADIHSDPDRLRKPVKKVNGEWRETDWQDAIEITAQNLFSIQQQYGDHVIGFYAGNPGVHNYGNLTHGTQLRKRFKTRNHFSATSLDQLPHQLASHLMYGHQFAQPIPDIDRTQMMVIIGGNPMASNGSMMTVPNVPKRLKRIQQRGGKIVVIDPRFTETAAVADQHHFIRPGSDAWLLLAIVNILFAENWLRISHLENKVKGLDLVAQQTREFTPETAEHQTGIQADAIRQLAHDLAHSEKALLYGRLGVSVQEFGALCQWAIQVINILIGALNTEGGTLLTSPAFASVRRGTPAAGHFNRHQSRVSGLPEFAGELPAAAMAEEILTEGEGQIRAMITIAGNPMISSVNAALLESAFESLDFYVAFDFYINASTRHADVILPPTSPLEHDHYDIAFLRLAVRNSARYNPAIFEAPEGQLHDWEIYNAVTARLCELQEVAYQPLPSPDQIVAAGIAADIYGEEQNPSTALTLEKVKQHPHGIDLGPLQTDLDQRIATEDSLIDAAPEFYLKDLQRLKDSKREKPANQLLLIGRRHLRSNNSWMHNYHRLVKGPVRWQLLMHPDDLAARGIADQAEVTITSRVGQVTTRVRASDEVMPGVVSLPHGWGHTAEGIKMAIASQQQGVNCNLLTDDKFLDALSGNAALNGVPVEVRAA